MNTTSNSDIIKLTMKIVVCLLYSAILVANSVAAETNLFEDPVSSGPRAGRTVKLIRAQAMPESVIKPLREQALLNLGTERVRTPVQIQATRYEGARTGKDRDWSFACFEFRIRAETPARFDWACWVADFPQPHRFQILSGNSKASYACFVGAGVHVYRLHQERNPDTMRQRFWEESEHPDALPTLPLSLLFEALSRTNMLGLGPRTWNVTVSSLSDAGGEVHLTLHGSNPEPKCTFALRKGTWELVSQKEK